MTGIVPNLLPALPAAPMGASIATVDASVLLLPLALGAAITAGFLVERARDAWRASRPRHARRVLRVVSMQRAA